MELGTPGQTISAILDTGSYTLLVDPDCTQAADPEACLTFGYYDTTRSVTARYLNSWFAGQFGTGYMQGFWYSDTAYVGLDSTYELFPLLELCEKKKTSSVSY